MLYKRESPSLAGLRLSIPCNRSWRALALLYELYLFVPSGQ